MASYVDIRGYVCKTTRKSSCTLLIGASMSDKATKTASKALIYTKTKCKVCTFIFQGMDSSEFSNLEKGFKEGVETLEVSSA